MTVSVIIPCYNHAAFVAQAIESAAAQDWPDTEVVVVDDGSTDGSAAEIRRGTAHLENAQVVTQSNQGLSAARNAGLARARGCVVIFLDADDRLLPGAARAAATGLSHAMMTFGRCVLVDAAGAPLPTNLPVVERDFYAELLRRNYIWTPAMAAFRREVFDVVGGFDRRVNAAADYDMYLRVTRLLPVAAHDTLVAEYRRHDANMSADPVGMLDATMAVLRGQRAFVAAHQELRPAYREGQRAWREFYGEHLVERFRSALHAGEHLAAAAYARQLLRLYPRGVVRHLTKKARLMLGAGAPADTVQPSQDCATLPRK